MQNVQAPFISSNMDSFVYDIDHTILIEEMNASIWPYIYMSSSFVLICPLVSTQSAGNCLLETQSIFQLNPLPEISSTFIITYFYFILLLLLDSFCERIVVVS